MLKNFFLHSISHNHVIPDSLGASFSGAYSGKDQRTEAFLRDHSILEVSSHVQTHLNIKFNMKL